MKRKFLQFICRRCGKPVFRIGANTNPDAHICGRCRNRRFRYSPRRTRRVSVSVTPLEIRTIPAAKEWTVLQIVQHYRAILDRVETLFRQDPGASFLELYEKAKKDRI